MPKMIFTTVTVFLFFSIHLCRSRTNLVIDDNHFVVTSPWCLYICKARIYNVDWRHVLVSIKRVPDNKYLTPVRIDKGGQYEMKIYHDSSDPKKPNASSTAWVVTSTGRMKVFVYTDDRNKISVIQINPKSYCYRTYYTVTVFETPFITVIALDFSSTNVVIGIPKYNDDNTFDVECNASSNCRTGSAVNVTLTKYQVWYFTHTITETAHLNHVKITADQPVNVVSGNIRGKFGGYTTDQCTTSLKPWVTWGKSYVIPGFISDKKAFAVSTTNYPLTVIFHRPNGQSQTYTVTSPLDDPYHVTDNLWETLAVTADVPFGLYQFFYSIIRGSSGTGDAEILNLIPVEQWKPGAFYICHKFEYVILRSYLISQATPDEIKMEINGKTIDKPVMKDSLLKFDNKTYYIANITECDSAKIFSTNPTKKIMIYTLLLPKGSGKCLGAVPYSYYQGEIYQPGCQISDQLYLQDGVDNDCDGHIDEEIKNGLDDDGDGLIDEDSVEKHSDGVWSEWSGKCKQKCNNGSLSVRTRTCASRSTFGKYCPGPSIQCNESTCPRTCSIFNRSVTDCVCEAMCLMCYYSIFDCDGCRPGYMPTEYCKTPCPKGRGGLDCREARRDNDVKEKADLFLLYVLVCSFILLTVLIMFGWFLGEKNNENQKQENTEEEESRESKTSVGQEEEARETVEENFENRSTDGQ